MSKHKRKSPLSIDELFDKAAKEILDIIYINRKFSHYDYNDPATLRRIESEQLSELGKHFKQTKNTMSNLHSTGIITLSKKCFRKRSKAVTHYAKFVHDKYIEKYSEFCIEDTFFDINIVTSSTTYDVMEFTSHLTYAISLWILDELSQRGKLYDAMQYLPDNIYEDDVNFPEFEDSCHCDETICRMMYVIQNRDDDKCIKNNFGPFINEATLAFNGTRNYISVPYSDQMTNRQRFDSIISMIPDAVIKRAVERFENNEWEYVRLCLDSTNRCRQEELKLLDEIQCEINEDIRREHEKRQTANPLLQKADDFSSFAFTDPVIIPKLPELPDLPRIRDSIPQKLDQYNHLYDCRKSLSMFSFSHDCIDLMFKDETINAEEFELLEQFSVQNPYETLFAFLYLLDSGSDIPWLFNQTLFILETAISQLPLAFCNNDERDWENDPEDYEEDSVSEEAADADQEYTDKADASEDKTNQENTPIDWIDEEKKLYSREFTDACLWCDPDNVDPNKLTRMNFAQIAYENTYILPPRNVSDESGMASYYEKSGFVPGEARILERYCTLANSSIKKELERYKLFGQPENQDTPVTDDTINQENEQTRLIAEYKNEIERLKNEIHAIHDSRNEFRQKSDELTAENNALRSEIAELRDMIHSPSDKDDTEKVQEERSVEYPYILNHRYIVYGGHPSWLKAIKPLLKNIRFIDSTTIPNQNLIMNADAIWIQSNAIGHAFYYKILDITRNHNIPLEYFSYASAEKCAEQIIEYDKANE